MLGRRPVLLGRDRGCDVALLDPHVSRHHALVWSQEGRVFVRDLGSALGTRVGARRLEVGEALPVEDGERIRLAERIDLRVVSMPGTQTAIWAPQKSVHRVGGHWRIEQSPTDVPPSVRPGLGTDKTLPASNLAWGRLAEEHPCTLTIVTEHGLPVEARFEGTPGQSVRVRGNARVVLIFLLARQRLRYDQRSVETPWLEDSTLRIGLWGARAVDLPPSRLNTLMARVREQLETAGFPRDLLEKRHGQSRLSNELRQITLPGWSSSSLPAVP